MSPPLCWTKHQDPLAERLKQGRSQLAGEVHTNIKVLSKIEPKKKKIKIFIECFRYDWNAHKNKKGVTHFPESEIVRPAALRRKTFHEKGHLPDFSRRPEKFILKHQRSVQRKVLSASSASDPGQLQPWSLQKGS